MTSSSNSSSNTHTQDITAVYDIIWHASTHPSAPLSVQTLYSGSRILFRKRLVPIHSLPVDRYEYEYEYRAVLKFEGWESVYGCDKLLFRNFDILSLPAPSTFQLSPIPQASPDYTPLSPSLCSHNPNTLHPHPHPLLLTFTNSKDDEGYPLLHFEIEASTEMVDTEGEKLQMCAVGWAKRREFDDEVPGVDTCLSVGERERLVGRGEVDMAALEREGDGLEEGEVREWS